LKIIDGNGDSKGFSGGVGFPHFFVEEIEAK
jgi:hypothetical protein